MRGDNQINRFCGLAGLFACLATMPERVISENMLKLVSHPTPTTATGLALTIDVVHGALLTKRQAETHSAAQTKY